MTSRLRYLVTGREGQVVQSLLEQSKRPEHDGIELVAIGRPTLDLSKPESIRSVVEEVKPDLIISAAAYTAVDQAESDEDTARAVNALGPRALAKAAALRGIPIIHLSTDYVFDGMKSEPYVETDAVGPMSAYGRTKLEGERALLEATDNAVILRTAWVYSPFGKNFVKTMLRLAETRKTVNVVADQIGNPTSALDIADGIFKVARNLTEDDDRCLRGIFHMSGRGEASWADLAEEIFRFSASKGGPSATVARIPTADYPTPAKRPANSRLSNFAIRAAHVVELPNWQSSVHDVVQRLFASRTYL